MEAVNPHLERVEPLFDEVSVGVVDLTAQQVVRLQSGSRLIDEKHGV
jgi:hypothetical protein